MFWLVFYNKMIQAGVPRNGEKEMGFRPCIDIHNGKVKQVIGASLQDENNQAEENFISKEDARYYAKKYKEDHLTGGHIILLNPPDSKYYPETKKQALQALQEYPGGMQIGGGITDENALEYIQKGASHVIVTSFVFQEGKIHYDRLESLCQAVGKQHVVLDLSCRKKGEDYYIATNRWQTLSSIAIKNELLEELAQYCDEFLIHAVDVEGKVNGIETELVERLMQWNCAIPMTYAGGIASLEDIKTLQQLGKNKLDYTIGSALDIFGGHLKYQDILQYEIRR